MSDIFSKEKRSWIMERVRSRYNKSTELEFIKVMRGKKITGWRRNYPLLGKPDFVFPKSRVAVFVDGCFWHGCPKHCRMPSSNSDYWADKIGGNIRRDRRVTRKLRAAGWSVIRFWEHDLQNKQINKTKLRRLTSLVNPSASSPRLRGGAA